MPRWSSIKIGALRRLSSLHLEGLRTFNLIVGPNNSGKTTVLEAIRLLGNPLDAWNWVDASRSREIKSGRVGRLESLRYLFPQTRTLASTELFEGLVDLDGKGAAGDLSVKATLREFRYEPAEGAAATEVEPDDQYRRGMVRVEAVSGGGTYPIEFEVDRQKEFEPPEPSRGLSVTNTRFLSPVHHRVDHGSIRTLSDLLEGKMKSNLITELRSIDPTIDDILVVVREGRGPEIRVLRTGAGGVPMSNEGDGVRRIMSLAAEAFALVFDRSGNPGVLLVDEIETALHPTAMEKALMLLKVASDVSNVSPLSGQGIQFFATTHSLEVMDAVSRVWGRADVAPEFFGGPANVAFYRLPAAGSGGSVVRYSWEEYRERRDEAGVDLR